MSRLVLLSVAVVLLCAVSASALSSSKEVALPGWVGDEAIQNLPSTMELMSNFELDEEPASSAFRLPGFDVDSGVEGRRKCKRCVKKVAEHIIKETLKFVEKKCDETKCPVWKARCEWIENNEDIFTGYLIGKLRPGQSAYNFCAGARRCKIHPWRKDGNRSHETRVADPESESDIVSTSRFGQLLDKSSTMQADDNVTSIDGQQQSWSEFVESDSDISKKGDDKKKKCLKCVAKVVKREMEYVIEKIVAFCKNATCPYIQKRCEWAKEHKGLVRGYIYAKLQPVKFAAGLCIGAKKCVKDADAFSVPADLFTSQIYTDETEEEQPMEKPVGSALEYIEMGEGSKGAKVRMV